MRNLHQKQLVERYGKDVLALYDRKNARDDPVGNRHAFSELVSQRVEREGIQQGHTIETLCTEIGYRAISKIFAVNMPSQSIELQDVYSGPRA